VRSVGPAPDLGPRRAQGRVGRPCRGICTGDASQRDIHLGHSLACDPPSPHILAAIPACTEMGAYRTAVATLLANLKAEFAARACWRVSPPPPSPTAAAPSPSIAGATHQPRARAANSPWDTCSSLVSPHGKGRRASHPRARHTRSPWPGRRGRRHGALQSLVPYVDIHNEARGRRAPPARSHPPTYPDARTRSVVRRVRGVPRLVGRASHRRGARRGKEPPRIEKKGD